MTRIGVIGNPDYPGLAGVVHRLQALATTSGFDLCCEPRLAAQPGGATLEDAESIDLLVTLGGDGTLLRGARFLAGREIPVLGINLGRLGFLTTCGLEVLEDAVKRVVAGDYHAETRMVLESRAGSLDDDRRWYALNDIVLHKGGKARVMWLRVEVDGEEIAAYAADGIVIATPTGSTAYSLSAGGAVVVPGHDSILVTPISAHALAIRPLVLSPQATVVVHAEGPSSDRIVTVDGQVSVTLDTTESLTVRRAGRSVILVRFPEMTFFARMRRKLGWSAPADDGRG